MGRPIMYWSEVRERAVRMVSEHRGEHRWEWAAICSIAAAAEWHLSISAPPEDRDYRPTIAASDTRVSWWRSQWAGGGLANAVEVGFRQWAQELSVTIVGGPDHGTTELFGAELCADLAAEHAAWKTFAEHRRAG